MRFLHENDMPRAVILRTHFGRAMPHACAFAPVASTIPPSYSRGQLVIFRAPYHDLRRRRCVLRRFIRFNLDILYRPERPSLAEEDCLESKLRLSQKNVPSSSNCSLYPCAFPVSSRAGTEVRALGRNASVAAASFHLGDIARRRHTAALDTLMQQTTEPPDYYNKPR